MAERGLAAARGSDERKLRSLIKREVYVFENVLAVAVCVGYVLELYRTLYVGKLLCVGRVRLGFFIHYFNKSAEAARAVLELLHEAYERVHGRDKEVYGNDEGGVVTE